VSVDRCAFCEGIFLDAGELDSLFMKRDEERKGFLAKLLGA
jgi:Zn-finger nucleic acid-binding protein